MSIDAPQGNTVLESPPGIDVPAVTSWLAERLPELEPPLRFRRVGEGQSNLTYRVDAASGTVVVVRRPPLGEILQSAHDVAREHRILTGLSNTGARVPRTLALCEDPEVTGAPFYVMEHVDGLILNRVSTAARLSAGERAIAGHAMATTLVQLHSVDLDRAGLDDLRRPESLASRQLRRWTRQWHASTTEDLPLIDELAEELATRMPSECETALVHGDYHLHNAIFGPDGTVRAVLDWELCTVGDPLADVGVMIAYWNELGAAATGSDALFREPVTELPGFPTTSELAASYARASDRDLTPLGFWVAFAYWKIAIIVEGVYRRWLNDPANGSDAGSLRPAVARLAGLAGDALEHPGSHWVM
jgi:aminoglycoside phosphotransferase (APT) family kinase protein